MSVSSYLDNAMRSGQVTHNARITLSGTTITLSCYDGTAFKAVDSLLIRFSSTSDAVVSTGTPSHDFGTATWGLPAYDGLWDIQIGIQKLTASTAQVVIGLSREPATLTTVLNASATNIYAVVSPVAAIGEVVWVATLHDVARAASAWDTTNSYLEEK